jgi:hypothetical protein
MTAGILRRRFPNLSGVERDEAADTARYRIAEAMTLGRIEGMDATSNWPIISYVKKVVENAGLDVWRARREMEGSDELVGHAASGPSPEAWAAGQELLACVKRLLSSVTEADRLIFFLKLAGLSTLGIAGDLHRLLHVVATAQTIDTRFSRLRARIQQECSGR